MTNNEKRIAIAELSGLRPRVCGYTHNLEVGTAPQALLDCPDYPQSRDAMAKALRLLDDEEWLEYMLCLRNITQTHYDAGKWATARMLLESTPAQQAEAFLKVKGKWVEE